MSQDPTTPTAARKTPASPTPVAEALRDRVRMFQPEDVYCDPRVLAFYEAHELQELRELEAELALLDDI